MEPDLPCNVCGAWIQGSFAVIDTQMVQEPQVLTPVLMRRSPHLGFLWLGAVLLDIQHYVMRWARPVAFQIDLGSAAQTNSYVSFIQKPVSCIAPNPTTLTRSDEARLMYLSQAYRHGSPPLVPFTPFGSISIADCILEVQIHAACSAHHGLRYGGLTWNCKNNTYTVQKSTDSSTILHYNTSNLDEQDVIVEYDKLNRTRDCSESMTRLMFKWLRDADGFPIAKRALREHEWIKDGWSSDEESVAPEGDGKSMTSRRIGPWLCRGLTARCNTI